MTVWQPLTILQAVFPFAARRAALQMSKRWIKAGRAEPRLAEDLITLGGVLAGQPARIDNGWPVPALPDATRLAYEAGRRDMALQILALMSLTPHQLNTLAQEPDYGVDHDD